MALEEEEPQETFPTTGLQQGAAPYKLLLILSRIGVTYQSAEAQNTFLAFSLTSPKAPLNKSKSSTIRLSLPLSLQGFQRLIRAPRRLIQRCPSEYLGAPITLPQPERRTEARRKEEKRFMGKGSKRDNEAVFRLA